jgi:hypothetical protein
VVVVRPVVVTMEACLEGALAVEACLEGAV